MEKSAAAIMQISKDITKIGNIEALKYKLALKKFEAEHGLAGVTADDPEDEERNWLESFQ